MRSKKTFNNPVRKEGAWPALVDKDTFDSIHVGLNGRAPKVVHPRVTSSQYLLSGLIKCRKCGAAYIGYGAKSGRHHYYVCGTTYSKGKETCPSQHLPKEKLEPSTPADEYPAEAFTDPGGSPLPSFVQVLPASAVLTDMPRLSPLCAKSAVLFRRSCACSVSMPAAVAICHVRGALLSSLMTRFSA